MNGATILAAAGIGSARLILRLPGPYHPRGSILDGTVEVIGGWTPQRINRLSVYLKERLSMNGRDVKVHGELVIASSLQVSPGESKTIPFNMEIPDNANLPGPFRPQDVWFIEARAWISLGHDPRVKHTLNVVIHREMAAIHLALESLGFTKVGWHFQAIRPGAAGTVAKYFRSRPKLRRQFEGISIHLRANEQNIVGRMEINRKELDVTEQIRGLAGGRRLSYDLNISREALLTLDGLPYPGGAISSLAELIESAVDDIENEKTILLRPADAPTEDGRELLRPANAGFTSSKHLLRPSGDEQ